MNKYEILYILVAGLEEEAYNASVEKYKAVITSSGGSVEDVDKWGLKRLAYPINFKNDGYYVVMNFTANADLPQELERLMRISDDCIRFLITRKD